MTSKCLRIGELASASGVSRDALRYYERKGLLSRPRRTPGGFREYDPATLDRIRFIKQAQAQGLSIREIHELTSDHHLTGRGCCRRVHDLLANKIEELDTRRRELEAFSISLRERLEMCKRALAGKADAECPVVEAFGKPSSRRDAR